MDYGLFKTTLLLIAGGFLIFLAITILRDNIRDRLNQISGLLFCTAGLGPLSLAIGRLLTQAGPVPVPLESTSLYSMHWAWECFFPALVIFSIVYPVDRFRQFRSGRLIWLLFLPPVSHVIISLYFRDVSDLLAVLNSGFVQEGFFSLVLRPLARLAGTIIRAFHDIYTHQEIIFGGVNLAYSIAALLFLQIGRNYVANPRLKQQTTVVLWAFRSSLVCFAAAWIIGLAQPFTGQYAWRDSLLLFAILSGSILLAIAVMRYQFLNLQSSFRQSLLSTLTSGLLVAAYLFIGMEAEARLSVWIGSNATAVSWILLFMLLLAYHPVSSWLDALVRSLFMRTRADHRNIIERFSRQIISQFDSQQLRGVIEETLKTSLLVDDVYFTFYDDAISEYRFLGDAELPQGATITRTDRMLGGINLLDAPTPYSALQQYSEDSVLAQLLDARRIKLILPLKDARTLLGFVALTEKAAGFRYTPEDLNLLGVMANQMVTALTNARLHGESLERIRLQEEMSMARQIQLNLLPKDPPRIPGLSIAAFSSPSRTVGGDFYDFIPLGDAGRIGIVIADASGKGMPAALLVAQIQAILRSEAANQKSIGSMLCSINRLIAQSTSAEKYVTLFYAEFDPATRLLEYCNAGHNYPLLIRRDGAVEPLIDGGPIIGAFPEMTYGSRTVQLHHDDLLFLFTDGLSEAMNGQQEEYGERRLADLLQRHRTLPTHELMACVVSDVAAHDPSSPPQDDTTMIVLKIDPVRSQPGNQDVRS